MESTYGSRLRRRMALSVVIGVTGLVAALPAVPAGAVQSPQATVVNDDPANWTPHVLDGQVNAIAQVGSTVYLGGIFTQVREAEGEAVLTRSNFVAFDATTGAISPLAPTFNGEVTSIIASADGASIYVGGFFTNVSGTAASRLVRLDTATGARVAGFNPVPLSGAVRDLRLVGNRLWVAGNFTHVNGVAQPALATLNATTGARDPFMGRRIAGTHNGGTTFVLKIDVSPDGRRLFAIGNFKTLDGVVNDQVLALDIDGTSAVAAPWRTSFFNSTCASGFNTFMRDLDISPDGAYVVFSTTGAYRGTTTSCDSISRFEAGATGTNVPPSWINYTGGDTTYAVAISGEAVYVGGHFRWMNNPFAGDRAAAGAVSREGIAALDPANGLPLSWNPGRTRGVGVFDLLATPAGLWAGSDTDRIGHDEFHGRIAFFPLAGGTDLPANNVGQLPGTAFLLGTGSTTNVVARSFDGRVAGPAQSIANGGVDWRQVRGAVMIDGTLYTGLSDGRFVGRSFDGLTFGPTTLINTSDLLVNDAAWHTDVRSITGMFFERGRLYYTVAGQNSLYYRYFTPASGVIGAQRFTASGNVTGISFSSVRSMFLGGGFLYWNATGSGNLNRMPFPNGAPVAPAEVVSGPATSLGGVDWTAQDAFLFVGQPRVPNRPPVAAATASCSAMTCSVSGAGSTDPDNNIATYSWNFGDGTPSVTGVTASHTYAVKNTYTVTLTVTDTDGSTSTATQSVSPQPAPTAAFTATCTSSDCHLDGTASSDPDGTVASYAWDFGDGSPAGTGATVDHVYATPGDYIVALTVTDNAGATNTATQSVHAAPAPATIAFVGSTTRSVNSQTHRMSLPAAVEAGDGLLLFASSNNPAATMSEPSGAATWELIGTVDTGSLVTRVWKAAAGPASGGTPVQVTTSALSKVTFTVLAYRGTAPDPVAAFNGVAETTTTTAHATPTAPVTGPGSWVVSYWAQKDSDTSLLTGPAALSSRVSSSGTGSGRAVVLAADSAAPAAQGTYGGQVATAAVAARHATMFTIVLRPA